MGIGMADVKTLFISSVSASVSGGSEIGRAGGSSVASTSNEVGGLLSKSPVGVAGGVGGSSGGLGGHSTSKSSKGVAGGVGGSESE